MEIHTKNDQAVFKILEYINLDQNEPVSWDLIFDLISRKFDEYKKQLEEKQKIIDRLIKPEENKRR